MKSMLCAVLSLVVFYAGNSIAAEVKGNVEINVKAGDISQKVGGLKSKNELKLGTVSGDAQAKDVEINVQTGDVVQKSKGLWKKSKVKIGNVE